MVPARAGTFSLKLYKISGILLFVLRLVELRVGSAGGVSFPWDGKRKTH